LTRWVGGRSAAFALTLALASLGTIEKYAGTEIAVAYFVAMFAAVPLANRYVVPFFLRTVGEREARWLAFATLAALVALFVVVYPVADSDELGSGSDRDDAANLATGRLLDGEDPYDEVTYLGNPVSQLPGALLYAAPFVVLGNSAYQNFFWLSLFFLALGRRLGSLRLALFAVWMLFALSPELLRELLTGGDLIANSIYVALFMLAVVGVRPSGRGVWLGIAAAVALGVAYSSRSNFLFTVPLLAGALYQLYGLRVAIVRLVTAALAFAAVTLPFYVHDRDGFTPAKTAGKLTEFNELVPHLHLIVIAAAGVLALGLAARRFDRAGEVLMSSSAAIQLAFLFTIVVLDSIDVGRITFAFLIPSYGLVALFFATLGTWPPWVRYRRNPSATTSS
jgi:hypothetical protein